MARTRYDASLVSNVSPCTEAMYEIRGIDRQITGQAGISTLSRQESLFPVISLCPR